MTEHTGLAAKLKELGEKATPGEWLAQKGAGWLITRPGAAKRHEGAMLVGMRAETSLIDAPKGDEQEAAANAALIVALVNNLSAIIAALEARPPATEGEVERDDYAQLLGFVTRMVWRKPELSDHEIVEVIRFRPDVHSNMLAWGRHAEDNNDEHLRSKLAEVAAKRQSTRAALSAARPSREEG